MTTMYLQNNLAIHQEVQGVLEISSYKKWDRDRNKEKDNNKRREKKDRFQEMLEKKEEEGLGQMGSFFEARA